MTLKKLVKNFNPDTDDIHDLNQMIESESELLCKKLGDRVEHIKRLQAICETYGHPLDTQYEYYSELEFPVEATDFIAEVKAETGIDLEVLRQMKNYSWDNEIALVPINYVDTSSRYHFYILDEELYIWDEEVSYLYVARKGTYMEPIGVLNPFEGMPTLIRELVEEQKNG